MTLPHDYLERVYAGVLGKIIGVYLGRPFEQWSHERIAAELGTVEGYVHERLGVPLVVTDDDISGTFTFLRALPDYGCSRELTPAQIGQTWLNYIVEGRSILWWGGLGRSTEHTAYLRLKAGLQAPASGAIATNGPIIAEQIGAQIFIDGWAMVAPGDPELAADLARRAASVSHDGAAIHGAQALAAMAALAFVEPEVERLLDGALRQIPPDGIIARLADDLRDLRAREADWRAALRYIIDTYGYGRYKGDCHIVPNHALVLLGLLWGDGDFARSLSIICTAGYDTDCNAGNLGCLLAIRGGLAAIDAGPPDWRGPVADRLFLPTADGGRAISDAVSESYQVANIGRALKGLPPLAPKRGAQFHFELPGAVQGFRAQAATLANVSGKSGLGGRCLAIRYDLRAGAAASATTPVFTLPDELAMPGYELLASPRVYPGQTAWAAVAADAANGGAVSLRLYGRAYGPDDALAPFHGPEARLAPGAAAELRWTLPDRGGPIAELGVELTAEAEGAGALYLDALGWEGAPAVTLGRPAHGGTAWRRAWVNAVDLWSGDGPTEHRLVQNSGRGLLIQGTREWADYEVRAVLTPALCEAAGIAARVQGLRRFYGLLLCAGGEARLLRALDGDAVLASAPLPWRQYEAYELRLRVSGDRLRAWVDGRPLFDLRDPGPLTGGAAALVIEAGHGLCGSMSIAPAT
jgi:ADP-ribosylglycohydrolase